MATVYDPLRDFRRLLTRGPIKRRLMDKVIFTAYGCWEWAGCRLKDGYGRVGVGMKTYMAHRVSYEAFVGDIPDGLELDHLCRNRACVNPDHLEPVDSETNRARGLAYRWESLKTKCPRGHAYEGPNLYLTPLGYRQCRTCNAARGRSTRTAQRLFKTKDTIHETEKETQDACSYHREASDALSCGPSHCHPGRRDYRSDAGL